MTRNEIRRRALRAAAAVSLTAGIFGCASEIEIDVGSGSGGGQGGASSSSAATATASTTTSTTAASTGDAPVEPDAGVDPADAALPMDASADAQVNCLEATDYAACCEAHNWAFEAGCMAWGPPMPPAMGVA